jgi:hypothetical protein
LFPWTTLYWFISSMHLDAMSTFIVAAGRCGSFCECNPPNETTI